MKSILKLCFVLLLLHTLTGTAAVTVTNLAQGSMALHSMFLKSDGSLWAMGYDAYGELGDGTYDNLVNRPGQIAATGIAAISAGNYHSLMLKSDGSLWVMGWNGYGQLGDGGNFYHSTNRPEQIVTSGVTAIAAGGYHSLFLKSNGSLWAMGFNFDGQLGDGTFSTSSPYGTNRPEQIVSGGVTTIAAGGYHSLFLKSDGSLWAMGNNGNGQLGDGTFTHGPFYGINRPEQTVARGVSAIAAGGYHSLFLKSDGSLWAMGYNKYGQLGDGSLDNTNQPEQIVASGVTAIAAGFYHSLFLKSDGSLWGMGYNIDGELGDGTTNNVASPEQIVANGVTAISAGLYHSLFLKSDGSLWGMGGNWNGPLGNGFTNKCITVPEQIYPSPQPMLTNYISARTNLQFSALCQFGGTFYLMEGTNLTQPLSQWTPVATNLINNRANNLFSATLTNAVSSSLGGRFYMLQSE